MSTVANDIRESARAIASWLRHEPAIRPDFRGADYPTAAAVIAVLISKGIDRPPAIYAYLSDRGCPHDLATIEFLLNAYDGGDRRHCVWRRSKSGRYTLLEPLA